MIGPPEELKNPGSSRLLMEVRAIRNKAAGRVEEPGVESPVDGRVRAIRDKAAGSVEVARGVRKAQEAALEDFPGPVD